MPPSPLRAPIADLEVPTNFTTPVKLDELFTPKYMATNSEVSGSASSDAPPMFGNMNEILPNYFLGPEESMENRYALQKQGVKLVINMCADKHKAGYKRYDSNLKRHAKIEGGLPEFLEELRLACKTPYHPQHDDAKIQPLLVLYVAADDVPSYDISQHLAETCEVQETVFQIRDAMKAHYEATEGLDPTSIRLPGVAVHCMAGVSRSTTVVVSYLMKKTRSSRDDVIKLVRARRPVIRPNNGFMNAMMLFEHCGYTRLMSEDGIPGIVDHLMRSSPIERAGFLRSYVSIMLNHSIPRDRELLGRLVHALLSVPPEKMNNATGLVAEEPDVKKKPSAVVPTSAEDVANVLMMAMDEEVRNQGYVDTPNMLGWWCVLTKSIAQYSPIVVHACVLASTFNSVVAFIEDENTMTSVAWGDAIHVDVLTSMVTDEEADAPFDAFKALLVHIARSYQIEDVPFLVSRTRGKAAGEADVVKIVADEEWHAVQFTFPVTALLFVAAVKNTVLDLMVVNPEAAKDPKVLTESAITSLKEFFAKEGQVGQDAEVKLFLHLAELVTSGASGDANPITAQIEDLAKYVSSDSPPLHHDAAFCRILLVKFCTALAAAATLAQLCGRSTDIVTRAMAALIRNAKLVPHINDAEDLAKKATKAAFAAMKGLSGMEELAALAGAEGGALQAKEALFGL